MCGLSSQCHAERVDVDLAAHGVGGDVGELALGEHAGVVVENVEGSAGVCGEVGERVVPLLGVADVDLAGDEIGVVRLHLVERVVVDVVHADGPPLACETLRRGQADTRGPTGDEDR